MTTQSAIAIQERIRLRHCLAFSTLLVAAICLWLPIRFEENDDPVMLLIASGGLSGVPDAHLVFVNYVYGFVLRTMYERLPAVEWYTWLFLFIHATALTVLLWGVLLRRAHLRVPATLLLVALFCLIEVRMLLHLQFTTTAALASTAGASLIFRPNVRHNVLGLLLILIGSLIRFEAFVLVILILSPVLATNLIRAARENTAGKPAGVMLLAVICVIAMRYVDYAAYEDSSEWRDYREYNEIRGRLNDNPNAGLLVDRLPAGVSHADYWLLRRFLPNTKVIDQAVLRDIVDSAHDVTLTDKARHVPRQLSRHGTHLLIIVCLLASLLVARRGGSDAPLLLATSAVFGALLAVISLDATLKTRIIVSATLPLLFVLAESWSPTNGPWPAKLVVATCVILLAGLQYATVADAIAANSRGRLQFSSQHALLASYLSQPAKHVVPFRNDYLIEAQDPFGISKSHFKGRIHWRGWLSRFPLDGHPEESFRVLLDGGGLFLRRGSEGALPMIAASIQDSYGISVTPRTVAASGSYVIVEFPHSTPAGQSQNRGSGRRPCIVMIPNELSRRNNHVTFWHADETSQCMGASPDRARPPGSRGGPMGYG